MTVACPKSQHRQVAETFLPGTKVCSPWGVVPPKTEARALFQMLGRNGDTIKTIRELIAIPPETERLLRAFVAASPEFDENIRKVLNFRKRVGEEFERLVAAAQRRNRDCSSQQNCELSVSTLV